MRHTEWRTRRFLSFLAHSVTRYSIHSPYLYTLIEQVIRSHRNESTGHKIEQIRKRCRTDRTIIVKTDFGAGGYGQQADKYPVQVRHVARTSLTGRRHARRLQRLVSFARPEAILEIGTSLGITTAYLAAAFPEARVISLEGCPELSRLARLNLRELGIRNAEVITGPFSETLPMALMSLDKAGMVYIDGNHRGSALVEYFNLCLEKAGNDTIMVIDDIRSSPDMEQAWEEIRNHVSVRVSLDLFFSGWLFFRSELSREHFKLRYF